MTGPTINLNKLTVSGNQSVLASSLVASVTDGVGKTITQYRFMDTNTNGGYFTLNGVKQSNNQWVTVTASNLASLSYVSGSGAGTDTVEVEVYDGVWSAYKATTVKTALPALQTNTQTVAINQSICAVSLLISGNPNNGNNWTYNAYYNPITDIANNPITQYRFRDNNTNGGYFTLNGIKQASNQWITISASDMPNLAFVGSSKSGTDSIDIAAFDGAWSNPVSTRVTTSSTATSVSTISYSSKNPTLPRGDKYSSLDTSANFLYGTAGIPLVAAVNQGNDGGDCWFLASLAEIAVKNPSLIKNAITSNGNGNYTVTFHDSQFTGITTPDNGSTVTVVVNDQLPTGVNTFNTSHGNGNWASIIEKAFVVLTGWSYYNALANGGSACNAYELLGGQATVVDYFNNNVINDPLNQNLVNNMIASLSAGNEIDLGSQYLFAPGPGKPSFDNGVGQAIQWSSGGHYYSVLGYDNTNNAFIIYNPWGDGNGTSNNPTPLATTYLPAPIVSSDGTYFTEFEMTASDVIKYADEIDISVPAASVPATAHSTAHSAAQREAFGRLTMPSETFFSASHGLIRHSHDSHLFGVLVGSG